MPRIHREALALRRRDDEDGWTGSSSWDSEWEEPLSDHRRHHLPTPTSTAAVCASRSHTGREAIALLRLCDRKSSTTNHGSRRILRGPRQVLPLGHPPEARHLLGPRYWHHGPGHGRMYLTCRILEDSIPCDCTCSPLLPHSSPSPRFETTLATAHDRRFLSHTRVSPDRPQFIQQQKEEVEGATAGLLLCSDMTMGRDSRQEKLPRLTISPHSPQGSPKDPAGLRRLDAKRRVQRQGDEKAM